MRLIPALIASIAVLATPTKAENAPKFKLFHVYYAVTNLYEVEILGIAEPAFYTREQCDVWRRLDVAARVAANRKTLPFQGEDLLILGSYCGGGSDI